MKSFSSLIVSLLLVILPAQSMAQGQSSDILQDSLKDITTVAVMGATGAVLGLSTLSFVDEPKDHLKNVLVGGALGIIIGVGFVAFNQANQSKKDLRSSIDLKDMPTAERVKWHQASLTEGLATPSFVAKDEAAPVAMTFSF